MIQAFFRNFFVRNSMPSCPAGGQLSYYKQFYCRRFSQHFIFETAIGRTPFLQQKRLPNAAITTLSSVPSPPSVYPPPLLPSNFRVLPYVNANYSLLIAV